MKEYNFSFIDPSEQFPNKDITSNYLNKLDNFLRKIKRIGPKSKINWKIKNYKINLKDDKSNSGYHVLMLIEVIADHLKNYVKDFDFQTSPPIDYIKNSIANDLLINSEVIKDFCIKCGEKIKIVASKCDTCQRACCIDCEHVINSNICIFCKLFFLKE